MYRKKPFNVLFLIIMTAFFSLGFKYESNELLQPANMYLSGDRLYVSDEAYGVRVYSVADKNKPELFAQIPLAGNTGLAVRDSIIYANSYDAILALRLHADGTIDTAKVIRRGWRYDAMPVDGVSHSSGFFGCDAPVTYDAAPMSAGSGGSYATFAVIDTFLYYIDGSSLVTMSVAQSADPVTLNETYIGWSVETLFPAERYLFVGGSTGMYIMDRRNPAQPFLIGEVQHFRACDPVVVQDTVAYVTLRGGNTCGGAKDQLLTVSIADPSRPFVIREYATESPYGLAVRDSLLYVSNGYRGYTLYDVRRPDSVAVRTSFPMHETRDFIWDNSTLYIMNFLGIEIMDVADPTHPVKLSSID